MKFKTKLYHIIARVFPAKFRRDFKQLMVYAGEQTDSDVYLGSNLLLSFLLLMLVSLIPFALQKGFVLNYLLYGILAFFLVGIFSYLFIYFKVEDRTRRVEDSLPDALQLVSANIRAGMTPYQALKRSARKEFGPLEEEINAAASKALGTESFSDALLGMSKKIKSEVLERSVSLFNAALKAGGKLATLLEELAKDIEENRALKKELVTGTRMYSAFILFTIIIATPLLLAVSIQFVDIMNTMQSQTGSAGNDFGLGLSSGRVEITPGFLTTVSIVMIIITAILASVLLGTVAEGQPLFGLRYAPFILGGSLIVFFVCRYLISAFFSGII